MKRVNAPPIPEGIKVKLEGEQEWKDVMQVFEDAGWLWKSARKPTENIWLHSTEESIVTIEDNRICVFSPDNIIITELTATEFLNQYQGTIEYEVGDWVVFINDGCFTTNNQKVEDIVQILKSKGNPYHWEYETTKGTITSTYPVNTRIRPATPEEIASVTKSSVEQPKKSDVYIWDGDVLPNEYWVKNPWPDTNPTEFLELFKKIDADTSLSGEGTWYHIKNNKYYDCREEKPNTELPIVPYDLWKSILEQPASQAEPVANKPRYHIDNVMGQNIAISCPTIELWDAVTGLIPNNRLRKIDWETYGKVGRKTACTINKYGGNYSDTEYYRQDGYTIITAEEFLRDNGVAIPQPKWSIVTTDGVTVYEGDGIWWLDSKNNHVYKNAAIISSTCQPVIKQGYKIFSTFEAAEAFRQEQLEPKSTVKEMWKRGDILPNEWLNTVEDFKYHKGESRGNGNKYYSHHRAVKEVKDGWALISGTADIWLAPKDQYPTYPKADSPDIVAKDSSIHGVKTVEPVIERTWEIGDKFTNSEGAIITITGTDERDTHVTATWVKRDGSIIHAKPAKTLIDNWLRRKAWVPYSSEPIPVTKENAYIGMKVVRGKDWEWKGDPGNDGRVGIVIETTNGLMGKHEEKEWLWVKWENEEGQSTYRIGKNDKYDLYIANENTLPVTEPDEWKVGDVLPEWWLRSGVKRYHGREEAPGTGMFVGTRKVETVENGWALISDTCDVWLSPKKNYPTYSTEVTNKQTIVNQTTTKTTSHDKEHSNKQEDSYSSNNKSSTITNFRVYPKVTSGQGYSTGKSSPAVYKVKPTVTEGYHREYSRK